MDPNAQTEEPTNEDVVTTEPEETNDEPQVVPLATHLKEKDRRREAEAQLAEARQTQAAATVVPEPEPEPEPEPSPLEKFAEEYPDEAPPADVHIAQRKWDAEQAQKQQTRQHETTLKENAKTAYATAATKFSAEKVGQTLALDRVLQVGTANLTPGDKVDFNAALRGQLVVGGKPVDPMDFIYQRCIDRTPELQQAYGDFKKQQKAGPKDEPTNEPSNEPAADPTTIYSPLVAELFS